MKQIFYALILLQLLSQTGLAEDQPSAYTTPEKIREDLDRLEQYVHKKLGLNDLDQPAAAPKEETTESMYDRGDLSHLHTKLDDQTALVAGLMDRIERLEHQDDLFDKTTKNKDTEVELLKEQVNGLQDQLDKAALEIEKLRSAVKNAPEEKAADKEEKTEEPKPAVEEKKEEPKLDLEDKSPEEIFDYAEKTLKAAEYDKAQNIFEHYVELDVNDKSKSKAHYYLGEICSLTKQPAKASDHYLKSFQMNTSGDQAAESLVKLGITLHNSDKTKAGCSALKKARAEYPKMPSSSKSLLDAKFKEFKCPTS